MMLVMACPRSFNLKNAYAPIFFQTTSLRIPDRSDLLQSSGFRDGYTPKPPRWIQVVFHLFYLLFFFLAILWR